MVGMSMLEPEDIALYQEQKKIRVIEMSTAEREQETIDLFNKIRPLLDQGYTYNRAIRKVRNITALNTNNAWYRNVIEYGESQGYPKEKYNRKGRVPKCKL